MGILKPPRTAIASPESIIGRNQKNLQIKMGVTERATTINDIDCTSTRASQQNQLLSDITSNHKDQVFRRTGLSVGFAAGTEKIHVFGFEPYTIPVEDHKYRITNTGFPK
jgi:hypothetical protein